MVKAFFAFLIALSLASSVSGASYYADVSVDLDASGAAAVSGVSNHPLLEPGVRDSLTSKKGGVWLFNLTLPEGDVFSDYVYAVDLPLGASVNYVKADSFRISSPEGRIRVSGSGTNRPMSVVIQYRMDGAFGKDYSGYFFAVIVLVLIFSAGVYFFLRKRKHKPAPVKPIIREVKDNENFSRYEGILTDRQKEILRILSESDKPVNQASICERLDLPKSSVSRNVATLVDLGLAEKRRVGISTFVSLKKE